jgi:hypothetical protein
MPPLPTSPLYQEISLPPFFFLIGHWSDHSSQVAIAAKSCGLRFTFDSFLGSSPIEIAIADPMLPLFVNSMNSNQSGEKETRNGFSSPPSGSVRAEVHFMAVPQKQRTPGKANLNIRNKFKILGLNSC